MFFPDQLRPGINGPEGVIPLDRLCSGIPQILYSLYGEYIYIYYLWFYIVHDNFSTIQLSAFSKIICTFLILPGKVAAKAMYNTMRPLNQNMISHFTHRMMNQS